MQGRSTPNVAARAVAAGAALVVSAAIATGAAGGNQANSGPYKQAGGWGKIGTGNGQLSTGGGRLAVDNAGNVYVADADNNRVQVFSAKGAFLRKWGTIGSGNGQFTRAADVAIAPDGSVWVADDGNSRYQQFSSSGAFQSASSAVGGESARAVAVDTGGDVLAAVEGGGFSGFRRYVKSADGWSTDGTLFARMNEFRADDIEASPDGTVYMIRSGSQNGGDFLQHLSSAGKLLKQWKLRTPGDATRALAVDLDCNVLASNSFNGANGFTKYSPSGKTLASVTGLSYVVNDLAVGPKGDVYARIQSAGIVHLVENRSKPATAVVSGRVTLAGGKAKVKYTLSGVACPSEIQAVATLSGALRGKASTTVAAGKTTVISIPAKRAAGSTAQFKIVLKTNGRPTTQVATVKVG